MENHKIIQALLDLGVEGPAIAVDVLRAANVELPPDQLATVMNAIVLYRANQRSQVDDDPTVQPST